MRQLLIAIVGFIPIWPSWDGADHFGARTHQDTCHISYTTPRVALLEGLTPKSLALWNLRRRYPQHVGLGHRNRLWCSADMPCRRKIPSIMDCTHQDNSNSEFRCASLIGVYPLYRCSFQFLLIYIPCTAIFHVLSMTILIYRTNFIAVTSFGYDRLRIPIFLIVQWHRNQQAVYLCFFSPSHLQKQCPSKRQEWRAGQAKSRQHSDYKNEYRSCLNWLIQSI